METKDRAVDDRQAGRLAERSHSCDLTKVAELNPGSVYAIIWSEGCEVDGAVFQEEPLATLGRKLD